MKSIQTAQTELNNLKNDVIGVFKNRNGGSFELVTGVSKDGSSIDTISITSFGAIQQDFSLPVHYGTLHLFPDNKNMNDMLSNPFEWDAFMKQF